MTSPLNATYEAFSVSHAAVLDGTTGAEEVDGDVYGVRTASLAPDVSNYDNTGDDDVLSTWNWLNFATITVESGYISMGLLKLLSGNDVTTTTQTGLETPDPLPVGDRNEITLWDEDSGNQKARPMLIRMPSRDMDGNPRVMDFVLYKVNFAPISFTGPVYKDGLLVSYTGRAVKSNKDEAGNTLTKRAVGRIINKPV